MDNSPRRMQGTAAVYLLERLADGRWMFFGVGEPCTQWGASWVARDVLTITSMAVRENLGMPVRWIELRRTPAKTVYQAVPA